MFAARRKYPFTLRRSPGPARAGFKSLPERGGPSFYTGSRPFLEILLPFPPPAHAKAPELMPEVPQAAKMHAGIKPGRVGRELFILPSSKVASVVSIAALYITELPAWQSSASASKHRQTTGLQGISPPLCPPPPPPTASRMNFTPQGLPNLQVLFKFP